MTSIDRRLDSRPESSKYQFRLSRIQQLCVIFSFFSFYFIVSHVSPSHNDIKIQNKNLWSFVVFFFFSCLCLPFISRKNKYYHSNEFFSFICCSKKEFYSRLLFLDCLMMSYKTISEAAPSTLTKCLICKQYKVHGPSLFCWYKSIFYFFVDSIRWNILLQVTSSLYFELKICFVFFEGAISSITEMDFLLSADASRIPMDGKFCIFSCCLTVELFSVQWNMVKVIIPMSA